MEQDKEMIEKLQNDGYIRRYLNQKTAMEELNISAEVLNRIAKAAGAFIKIGGLIRINMIALYDYIDNEYAVQ